MPAEVELEAIADAETRCHRVSDVAVRNRILKQQRAAIEDKWFAKRGRVDIGTRAIACSPVLLSSLRNWIRRLVQFDPAHRQSIRQLFANCRHLARLVPNHQS